MVAASHESQISAQRSPNLPQEATTARSPRPTRLVTAETIAPVPEAAKQSTGFWVWKTFGSRSRQRA